MLSFFSNLSVFSPTSIFSRGRCISFFLATSNCSRDFPLSSSILWEITNRFRMHTSKFFNSVSSRWIRGLSLINHRRNLIYWADTSINKSIWTRMRFSTLHFPIIQSYFSFFWTCSAEKSSVWLGRKLLKYDFAECQCSSTLVRAGTNVSYQDSTCRWIIGLESPSSSTTLAISSYLHRAILNHPWRSTAKRSTSDQFCE